MVGGVEFYVVVDLVWFGVDFGVELVDVEGDDEGLDFGFFCGVSWGFGEGVGYV